MKKNALKIFSLLMISLFGISALATENRVELNANQKKALVIHLQSKIRAHEAMNSVSDIVQDYRTALELARESIRKSDPTRFAEIQANFDRMANQMVDDIEAIDDKDAIIAIEKAQLQEIQSSGNYIFYFSRSYLNNSFDTNAGPIGLIFQGAWLVCLGVVDVVTFPITLVISIVTGWDNDPAPTPAPSPTPPAQQPIDVGSLIDSLKKTNFGEDKVALVQEFARHYSGRYITIAQVKQILEQGFSFDDDRINACKIFSGHVSDPQNSHQIAASFAFSDSKSRGAQLLGE
jgi:hypothetical protein